MDNLLNIIEGLDDDDDIIGFTKKNRWKNYTDLHCLHCGCKMECRPFPIGISNSGDLIITEGYEFCSPMCAKGYMIDTGLYKNYNIVGLTDTLYKYFRELVDNYDNPICKRIYDEVESFTYVPRAPQRKQFKIYGGHYDKDNIMEYYNKIQQKEIANSLDRIIKSISAF